MEIEVPEHHPYGKEVLSFLDRELTDVQQVKVIERLELLERFTFFDLQSKNKIEKIADGVYEVKVPIGNANLRFFGVLSSGILYLIFVFKKKENRIAIRHLRAGLKKAEQFKIKK